MMALIRDEPSTYLLRSMVQLPNGRWYQKTVPSPHNKDLRFIGWPAWLRTTLGRDANDDHMIVVCDRGLAHYRRRRDADAPLDPTLGVPVWEEPRLFATEWADILGSPCLLQRREKRQPLELIVSAGGVAPLYCRGLETAGGIEWDPLSRLRAPHEDGFGRILGNTTTSTLSAAYYEVTEKGVTRSGIWLVAVCSNAVNHGPGLVEIESVYDPATGTHTWSDHWRSIYQVADWHGTDLHDPLIGTIPVGISCLQSSAIATLVPGDVENFHARYIVTCEDLGIRYVIRRLVYAFFSPEVGHLSLGWSVRDLTHP
jgi:hypothetical protein